MPHHSHFGCAAYSAFITGQVLEGLALAHQPYLRQGGTITHSTNLPAQTLYYSIPSIYSLLQSAKIPLAIFYCGTSRGRGTRGAAWFHDYIEDQRESGSTSDDGGKIKSVILKGGIKGWVNAGEEYQKWMTAFEPDYWTQFADLRL